MRSLIVFPLRRAQDPALLQRDRDTLRQRLQQLDDVRSPRRRLTTGRLTFDR